MTEPSQAASAILIREATALDAHALAETQVRCWRAAYRGIIDDEFLGRMSVDGRRDSYLAWFTRHPPSSFLRVAVDEQARVIGYSMAGSARAHTHATRGEIFELYLLPEVQRRGIGTRLMRSMARGLDLRGMDSLVVWALRRNPAKSFYRRMGGLEAGTRETKVGSRTLGEIAYFWQDLDSLIAAPRAAAAPPRRKR